MGKIRLRKTIEPDLELLFSFQLDKVANYMAAFTDKSDKNKASYIKKWTHLMSKHTIHLQTILSNNEVVGSVAKYEINGKAELTYWINKDYWGRGIATKAVLFFLQIELARPIFARAASDNIASQKVLENSKFTKIGIKKGYANAREMEIEEFIYKLN